jgi:hypothetical protein
MGLKPTDMCKFPIIFVLLITYGLTTSAQIKSPVTANGNAGLEIKTGNTSEYAKQVPYESYDFQWYALPSPTQDGVTETSLAGDGSTLIVFYRKPRPSLNTDEGIVERWTGSNWASVANVTNQCHYPDVDVEGSAIVATWNDDGYDYGYGTNINGNWVSMTGTLLNKQWYPRASMAMGLPYMSFACMYSDGMPSNYYMLHIHSLVGTGDRIELNGGWTVTYTSVGLKTDITGDADAWYCVFSQQEFLYVLKGSVQDGVKEYTDLGEGFRMYNPVARPEIVLFQGRPIVAWLENENTELFVAEWDGSQWMLIGTGTLDSGTFNTIRMGSSASELFLVYTTIDSGSEISVNLYDGQEWYGLPDVQNQGGSSISTADIAVHNNNPVVAFTEDNQLYVKKYSASSPTRVENRTTSTPGMQCFPNPTNGIMEVTAPESGLYRIELKSLTGQLMYSGTLKGKNMKLDLSPFREGLYLLTLRNETYTETRKIIRQQ